MLLEEALLEPVARYFRFSKGCSHIPLGRPLLVADLGCGPEIRFYHYARSRGVIFDTYYGIDPLIADNVVVSYENDTQVRLVREPLSTKISIKAGSLDCVVGFAFLEHIDHPDHIVRDSIRLLKPGGKAIFTTPSESAKGILEFLSYRLGLISKREIDEHKRYFNRDSLLGMINPQEVCAHHEYFEFGWNNLLVLTKKQ